MNTLAAITPARMALIGVGWFGYQAFWAFHGGPMPLFLRGFTDSKFTISLVLSLAGVAGCLVPPVVGYLSDRTATRFGRRKPYIFCGFLGVFLCIVGLPHVGAFWSVALLAGVMYFALRSAEIPYLSLLPDVTPPEQRSTASGVMNLVGSFGLIACFTVSSALWDDHPDTVFYLVALAAFGSVVLAIAFIREPAVPQEGARKIAGPLAYLRSVTEETNALRYYIAQFLWWIGFWMISSFATLFVVEELQVAEGKSFLVLMTFSLSATVFALPLGMLGDHFDRKRLLSISVASWAVIQIIVGLSQNLTQALITVGISAIPFAAVIGVGYAFMLDLIPRQRTAEFVGFSTISIAAAQIIGPLIGGQLIDTFGYRSMFPASAAFMFAGFLVLQLVRPGAKAP